MKKYLKTGMRIQTNIIARVGVSETVVDLMIDITGSKESGEKTANGEVFGYIMTLGRRSCDDVDINLEFPVYIENDTGKMWYDDTEGQ